MEWKVSVDLSKAKPKTPWIAAFFLDLVGEIIYFSVSRSNLAIIFFVISCVVVFLIWYFEYLLKKSR